ILFISAKERQGLDAVLDEVIAVGEQRDRRVPTGELNQFVRRAIAAHQPPSVGGRRMKLLFATQAEVRPPTFVFFVNDASLLHFGYRRYLENKIREAFGFSGTAIRLIFKSRSEEQVESLGGGRATR
ncbi:MAG: ribosome biogenesis GTPase Der, partial [Dehalococcoidia bacterium]